MWQLRSTCARWHRVSWKQELAVFIPCPKESTMARSRRKTPIFGITNARSEAQDKRLWHQRWFAPDSQKAVAQRIAARRSSSPAEHQAQKARILAKMQAK